MKKIWLLATLLGFWPGPALAQSTDELVNDGKNTQNVTTQSMGYDRKSYSPLTQINTFNIKRLVPIWSTSLMNDMGERAAPTIYNGVMYVINGRWTFAIAERHFVARSSVGGARSAGAGRLGRARGSARLPRPAPPRRSRAPGVVGSTPSSCTNVKKSG